MSGSGTVRWGIVGPGRIATNVVQDFPHVPNAERRRRGESVDRSGIGLRRRARPGTCVRVVPGDHGRRRRRRALHRDPAPAARRDRGSPRWRPARRCWSRSPSPRRWQAPSEVVDAARRNEVFAMEAMWTRFQPAIVAARDLIADGAIGEVRQVQADLGVDRPYDAADRLFDPAQGGGAMLDLGVYVVSFAHYFLGAPDTVQVYGSLAPTGVEAEAGMLLGYAGRARRDPAHVAARPHPGHCPDLRHRAARSRFRRASTTRTTSCCTGTGRDPEVDQQAAAGRRLLARVDRGHRVRPGRADRKPDHAARRHPRRAAHPECGLRGARRLPPRGRHGRGLTTRSLRSLALGRPVRVVSLERFGFRLRLTPGRRLRAEC